jgi:hypothetical protein
MGGRGRVFHDPRPSATADRPTIIPSTTIADTRERGAKAAIASRRKILTNVIGVPCPKLLLAIARNARSIFKNSLEKAHATLARLRRTCGPLSDLLQHLSNAADDTLRRLLRHCLRHASVAKVGCSRLPPLS